MRLRGHHLLPPDKQNDEPQRRPCAAAPMQYHGKPSPPSCRARGSRNRRAPPSPPPTSAGRERESRSASTAAPPISSATTAAEKGLHSLSPPFQRKAPTRPFIEGASSSSAARRPRLHPSECREEQGRRQPAEDPGPGTMLPTPGQMPSCGKLPQRPNPTATTRSGTSPCPSPDG
jgi:hypothetical protein